jgi:hypothetical protein
MKFGGDRVDVTDLKMDVSLSNRGFYVRYGIIPDPFSGVTTPRGDLARLRTNKIAYKEWDTDFWFLRRGEGLAASMTWEAVFYGMKKSRDS